MVTTQPLRIEPWRKQLSERIAAGQLTEKGFAGMLEHLPQLDRLGRALLDGSVLSAQIDALLSEAQEDAEDPQAFWQQMWDELLGEGVVTVPPVPVIKGKTVSAAEVYGFDLMYMPSELNDEMLGEHLSHYGGIRYGFPVERKRLKDGATKVTEGSQPDEDLEAFIDPTYTDPPLPGRWVLIEYGWHDYANTLNQQIGVKTSEGIFSRDQMTSAVWEQVYTKSIAKLFGVSARAVRLPSVREYFAFLLTNNEMMASKGIKGIQWFTNHYRTEAVCNTINGYNCTVEPLKLGIGVKVNTVRITARRAIIVLPEA